MITSWALLVRGVKATVDDSCDDASLHAVWWMMAGCWNSEDFFCPGNSTYIWTINIFESFFIEIRLYNAHLDAIGVLLKLYVL